MKLYLNTFVFHRFRSSILLIVLCLFISQYSYSQKSRINRDRSHYYKNAIKGSFTFAPFIIGTSISIGYERYVSKHSSLELVGYYQHRMADMGPASNAICVMLGYKYFIISNYKGLNNMWVSGYLSYKYITDTHSESEIITKHKLYYYGIGGSIGKKVILSANRKWFIDFGMGVSYNKYHDKPIFSTSYWTQTIFGDQILLRPIIQIGTKF